MMLSVPAPGVLGNDNDPDGDDLTAVLDTDVSNGTLNLNADGSFTYTPDSGFSGTDSFTYHANDGTDDSNTVMVTIDVVEGEYVLYLPVVRRDNSGVQPRPETGIAVGLAAFPMLLGMLVLYRRKDRLDG
jgi:VCBS repeat-containing protein